jgi:hypothetical protein
MLAQHKLCQLDIAKFPWSLNLFYTEFVEVSKCQRAKLPLVPELVEGPAVLPDKGHKAKIIEYFRFKLKVR